MGNVKKFTTQSVDLKVETGSVSDITNNSAIVYGTVSNCPSLQLNVGFNFYYEATDPQKSPERLNTNMIRKPGKQLI